MSEQAQQVAISVKSLLNVNGMSKDQVRLVLIKCTLLTSAKLEAIKATSRTAVTKDTYESMAKSRYASAVGIAVSLEEIHESSLNEAIRNEASWSDKPSCSSATELDDCHILIIASDPSSGYFGLHG